MASWRIGSILGIPIEIGLSFLLVLPLIAYLVGSQVDATVAALNGLLDAGIDPAALTVGVLPWALGIVAAVGLFLGVLLHELGHSLVARRYGIEIESITLWFLGGIARLEEFPEQWQREFAVAIAGPIVSVALGALFYVGFLWLPEGLPAARFVVGYLAVLNVVLAAFNLLPGFPMDGGRILRALLARNQSRVRATEIAAGVGKAFAVLLAIGGILLFNVFWLAIAFFIYIGATTETRQTLLTAAFEDVTVSDIMTPAPDLHTVTPETSIEELIDRMIRERHTGYPVLDGEDLVGIVTLEDTRSIDTDRRASVTVGDIMTTELTTVSPDTDAVESMTTMQQEDTGRLLVTDAAGDLVGLISRTDLMTVFEIVRGSESSAVPERAVSG